MLFRSLSGLQKTAAAWKGKRLQPAHNNRLLFLSDERLIEAAVAAALELCRLLHLPQMTPLAVEKFRGSGPAVEVDEYGTDVLVLAWAKSKRLDPAAYEAWEKTLVTGLAAAVTL